MSPRPPGCCSDIRFYWAFSFPFVHSRVLCLKTKSLKTFLRCFAHKIPASLINIKSPSSTLTRHEVSGQRKFPKTLKSLQLSLQLRASGFIWHSVARHSDPAEDANTVKYFCTSAHLHWKKEGSGTTEPGTEGPEAHTTYSSQGGREREKDNSVRIKSRKASAPAIFPGRQRTDVRFLGRMHF